MVASEKRVMRLSAAELQVIDELVSARVSFIIIGGTAVAFHCSDRAVHDLDIWIDPSAENVTRLTAAVDRLGYALLPDTLDRLQQPKGQLKLGIWNTDVLSSLKGLEFGSCFKRASEADALCHRVMVLSRADLITTKSGSERAKDAADIAMLNSCP